MERILGRRVRAAFTLIELLVVIAVIALLIGILLPGLSHAKKTAKMLAEQVAIKQMWVAFAAYTTDFKDGVMPGYIHWDWAHTPIPINFMPTDPTDVGRQMEGTVIKAWPWRFLSNAGYHAQHLMIDKNTYKDFWSRSKVGTQGTTYGIPYNSYGSNTYQGAIAWNPSFGMNTVYIGGDYNNGAFSRLDADGRPRGGNTRTAGGEFYVTKMHKVRMTSTLMAFSSARGGDVNTSGWNNYGLDPPMNQPVVPGYYQIEPPRPHPKGRGSADYRDLRGGWTTTSNVYREASPVNTWGMLHPRHFNKAASVMLDGHAAMLNLEQLRDMRRWSNYATSADWTFLPGP